MNADQLIESYVSDVVRRLPRRLRADVTVELRTLLREELAGRVAARGGAPAEATSADALALLTGFARPAEVAARYGPTFTVIDPEDSRAFVKAAVIGIALVWAVGLVEIVPGLFRSIDAILRALQTFYFEVAFPSLIWPGILVVWFGAAAWSRRRWPGGGVWKPRPEESDRINRFGLGSALAFWTLGTVVLVAPPHALKLATGGRISDSGAAALAYDDDFLRLRGPIALAVIVAMLALVSVVLIRGRWEDTTRRAQVVLDVVAAGVFLWILGGDIFREHSANQVAKVAVGAAVLAMLSDLVLRVRRRRLAAATVPGS